MLLSHNINSKGLAFEIDNYESMSQYKHTQRNETDKQYSPRELESETSRSKRISDEDSMNHASLFPTIYNSMLSKTERGDF